jgi:cob(I)alamin adenosyltransferase
MKIYTKLGDDGTTGLLYGGRVEKNDPRPVAYGDVDEAQAAIGLARTAVNETTDHRDLEASSLKKLSEILLLVEGDLWKIMAELACNPEEISQLQEAGTRITDENVNALERIIDQVSERFEMPTDFVLPGENEVSARLDLARAITRRAERTSVEVGLSEDSKVIPYLNRLSDLLWSLARWQEETTVTARSVAISDDK